MKRSAFFLMAALVFLYRDNASAQTIPSGNILVGVFDGRTPCQELAKEIAERPGEACIKIKWRLILYKDSLTGNPSIYQLQGFVYKKENPGTGNWKITKGRPGDPNATVYELDRAGSVPILLLKADDNVLFFLNNEKKLLVGNRDFSYTLNRKFTPINKSR